jgi:hypothetical protein
MKTVSLAGGASLIEAMRRVHRSKGTILFRARCPKTNRNEIEYWQLQYIGDEPNWSGLLPSEKPVYSPKKNPVWVPRKEEY